MSDVDLYLRNRIYSGWQEVEIIRSITEISGSFDLKLTTSQTAEIAEDVFAPGTQCVLKVDGTPFISGNVDEDENEESANNLKLKVVGRDATGLLYGCAADRGQTTFEDKPLNHIISRVCEPFGVKVITETEVGDNFSKIVIQQGETVFELIERLCKNRAVIPMSDGRGNLVLTKAGTHKIGVVEFGKNVLKARRRRTWRDRFSEYYIKGQGKSIATLKPKQHTQIKAQAIDPGLKGIFRPYTGIAETHGDEKKFADRAAFEATRRAAKALKLIYVLDGWRTEVDTGAFWEPNRIVEVKDPKRNVNGDFLITSVTNIKNEKETKTTLELAPPAAFDRIPIPETSNTGGLF